MNEKDIEKLERLNNLHKEGTLTDKEFEKEKNKLVNQKSFLDRLRNLFKIILNFIKDIPNCYFNSIKTVFSIGGYISRLEYYQTLLGMIIFIPTILFILNTYYQPIEIPILLSNVVSFFFISISTIQLESIVIRRRHDTNKNGFFISIFFLIIPISFFKPIFNFIKDILFPIDEFSTSLSESILALQANSCYLYFLYFILSSFIFSQKSTKEKGINRKISKYLFLFNFYIIILINILVGYSINNNFDRNDTEHRIKNKIFSGANINKFSPHYFDYPLNKIIDDPKTQFLFINYLINHGADVNINKGDSLAGSPLFHAIDSGKCSIAKELLKAGAKVEPLIFTDFVLPGEKLKDKPLEHYIYYVKDLCSAKLLINKMGFIPKNILAELYFYQKYTDVEILNKKDVVEYLINLYANVNAKRLSDGNTILHNVVQLEEDKAISLLNLLLSKGADINDKNKLGQTPLMLANTKNTTLVKRLLKLGAKVNIRDKKGRTAIMYYNNKEVITDIFKNGAKINISDYDNISVLEHISKNLDDTYYNVKDDSDYIKWKNDFLNALQRIEQLEKIYKRNLRNGIHNE